MEGALAARRPGGVDVPGAHCSVSVYGVTNSTAAHGPGQATLAKSRPISSDVRTGRDALLERWPCTNYRGERASCDDFTSQRKEPMARECLTGVDQPIRR